MSLAAYGATSWSKELPLMHSHGEPISQVPDLQLFPGK